uniref:Elongator complex protein 5 n=1 Tax=Anopheles farauti TaxID=69004 RepID=A0A182Q577_9DIPT
MLETNSSMALYRRTNHKRVELLSSLALTQQKVIVIVDLLGIEPNAHTIVSRWVNEQKSKEGLPQEISILEECPEYPLMIVSRLERRYVPSQLFKYIAKCKRYNLTHLFVWITVAKLQHSFVLPYIEHMADTVITFEDREHIALLVKKSTGSITNRYYQFDPSQEQIAVVEVKRTSDARKTATTPVTLDTTPSTVNPASLGTFKIDLREEEVAARDALTLPFEFYKNTPDGGKILYHPDADDDLDEEDPDDDLLI